MERTEREGPSGPGFGRPRRSAARFGFLLGAVVLLVLPLLFLGAPHLASPLASPLARPSAAPLASPPAAPSIAPSVSYPTAIRHVFVIYLENNELSNVQSNGPYEMGLAKNYTQASNYYAPCHPSAPEYLAGTSGATWQCGSDSVNTYSTKNIGYLAQQAGLSWAGYM